MTDNNLGDLQKRILVALADSTESFDPDRLEEQKSVEYAKYGAVKDHIRSRWSEYYTRGENSFSASFSRSVHSLCDRGYLVGHVKSWVEYRGKRGKDRIGYCGGNRPWDGEMWGDRRPTLQYVTLTDEGRQLGESLKTTISCSVE